MAERTPRQIAWEQDYRDKLKLLTEINIDRAPYSLLTSDISVAQSVASFISNRLNGTASSADSNTSVDLSIPKDFDPHKPISTSSISNGKVVLPTGLDRKNQQKQLYYLSRYMSAAGFGHLDETRFEFDHPEENIFMPHWASILNLIYDKVTPALGVAKLHINSGFRTIPEDNKTGIDGHMAGIACDFKMYAADRYTFADTCWGLGIRAIGIGQTFVHVDCGYPGSWSYPNVPEYNGPGGR